MKNLKKTLDFIKWFNTYYYVDNLKLKDKTKLNFDNENIDNVYIQDIFYDFAPEEIDDFFALFIEKHDVNVKFFFRGKHFPDLMKGIKIPLTYLIYPIVGLRKWMSFTKKDRIPLKIKHLANAITLGELSTKKIINDYNK